MCETGSDLKTYTTITFRVSQFAFSYHCGQKIECTQVSWWEAGNRARTGDQQSQVKGDPTYTP